MVCDCITETVYTELNSKRLKRRQHKKETTTQFGYCTNLSEIMAYLIKRGEKPSRNADPKRSKLPSPKRRDRCRRPQRRDFTGRQGWPRLGATCRQDMTILHSWFSCGVNIQRSTVTTSLLQYIYIYTYTHIYIYIHLCTYIYIYISREIGFSGWYLYYIFLAAGKLRISPFRIRHPKTWTSWGSL